MECSNNFVQIDEERGLTREDTIRDIETGIDPFDGSDHNFFGGDVAP